ncbi:hypothetical protein ACN47E_009261 [Coniothyrium glycines]
MAIRPGDPLSIDRKLMASRTKLKLHFLDKAYTDEPVHGWAMRAIQALCLKKKLLTSEQYEMEVSEEIREYNRLMRRKVCQSLTQKITGREIRDKIYEELILPGVVPVWSNREYQGIDANQMVVSNHSPLHSPASVASSFTMDLAWASHMPEFWRRDQLGQEVLTELVQTWYRVHTFKILDCSLISDFVASDPWQTQVVPHAHISHVMLSLNQEAMKQDPDSKVVPEALRRLRCDLDRLLYLRSGTRVTISINSPPCELCSALPVEEDTMECPHPKGQRDTCSVLESADQIDLAIFDNLRKLHAGGLVLSFVLDDKPLIQIKSADDIAYERWAEKMLDHK